MSDPDAQTILFCLFVAIIFGVVCAFISIFVSALAVYGRQRLEDDLKDLRKELYAACEGGDADFNEAQDAIDDLQEVVEEGIAKTRADIYESIGEAVGRLDTRVDKLHERLARLEVDDKPTSKAKIVAPTRKR